MPTESDSRRLRGGADEDALVQDILADPWDQLARSVYADWLEDHGRPHHAELARAPTTRDDQRVDEEGYWQKARAAAPKPAVRIIHRRGFAAAQMSARDFLSRPFQADGPAWLRSNHITWLELESATDWANLSAVPVLAQTRGLRLDELAACKELAGLVRLTVLRAEEAGQKTMQALAEGPLSRALRHLDISGSFLSEEMVAQLLRPPLAASLVTLRLTSCVLTGKLVRLVTGHCGRLKNLDLGGSYPREGGLALLARSPLLRRLNRLGLARACFSSSADLRPVVAAVAASPACRLALSEQEPAAHLQLAREALGERLILERAR